MNKILLGTTCTIIAGTACYFIFSNSSKNISPTANLSAPVRAIASKNTKIDPMKFSEFQKTPEFKKKIAELKAQENPMSNEDLEKYYQENGFESFNWHKNSSGEITGFDAQMKSEVNVANKVVFNEEKWVAAEDSIVGGLNKNIDYQITSEDQAMIDNWKKTK